MMKKIEFDKLLEVEEAKDYRDGTPDSRLCSHCEWTDYGESDAFGQTNGGYISCEGSGCEDAEETMTDDLNDEYDQTKKENKLEDVKMEIKIDLAIVEQNLVKMTHDKIGKNVEEVLIKRIENQLKNKIDRRVNKLVKQKISEINVSNIYNIKVKQDGVEVNLFESLIKNMIIKANEASLKFNDTVEELIDSVRYNKVDDKFKEDEFKVLTTYSENNYGSIDSINISINGENSFNLSEGEVEDMTFNRNLNSVLNITELMRKSYLAGKDGKIMYEAEETKREEE